MHFYFFAESLNLFYFKIVYLYSNDCLFKANPFFFEKVFPLKNSDNLRIVYGCWKRLQNRIVKEYTK